MGRITGKETPDKNLGLPTSFKVLNQAQGPDKEAKSQIRNHQEY